MQARRPVVRDRNGADRQRNGRNVAGSMNLSAAQGNEKMGGLPKDLMAVRGLHPVALVTCDCGKKYEVTLQRSDSVVFGLPLFGCECGVSRDVLVEEAIEHLRVEVALLLRAAKEYDEGPQTTGGDINESPSYRRAMVDSGRGRLLS